MDFEQECSYEQQKVRMLVGIMDAECGWSCKKGPNFKVCDEIYDNLRRLA